MLETPCTHTCRPSSPSQPAARYPPTVPNEYHVPAPKVHNVLLQTRSVKLNADKHKKRAQRKHNKKSKPRTDVVNVEQWLVDFPEAAGEEWILPPKKNDPPASLGNEAKEDGLTMKRIFQPPSPIEIRRDPTVDPRGAPPKKTGPAGFFSFPREVREDIYFYAIRPDCKLDFMDHCKLHHRCIKDGKGSVNVLLLCSQTYVEAIETLHAHENIMLLKGNRGQLFRNMRDFGRPGKFHSSKDEYAARLPPRYCELQFLQFRKVAICLQLPDWSRSGWDEDSIHATLERLSKEISQISAAILKSHHLRSLRLLISRAYWYSLGMNSYVQRRWEQRPGGYGRLNELVNARSIEHAHIAFKNVIRPLIDLAVSKGISIGAEEDILFRGTEREVGKVMRIDSSFADPLVAWIYATIPVKQRLTLNFNYRLDTNAMTFDERTMTWRMERYTFTDALEKYPDDCEAEEDRRFSISYDKTKLKNAPEPYQLVPECRTCYAVFTDWEDLRQHLDDKPKHKTSYSEKAYNEIVPEAAWGGWVKCHTCARVPPSQTVTGLGWHYRNNPTHRRHGIVPRWKEDNHWWGRWRGQHPEPDTRVG